MVKLCLGKKGGKGNFDNEIYYLSKSLGNLRKSVLERLKGGGGESLRTSLYEYNVGLLMRYRSRPSPRFISPFSGWGVFGSLISPPVLHRVLVMS